MRTIKDKLRLTQHDILDAFGDCPDSLAIINRHIRALTPSETWVKQQKIHYHMKYNGWEQIGSKMLVNGYWAEELRHLKVLRRLKEAITNKGESTNGYPTQEEISRAKDRSIDELFDFRKKKKTSKGFTALCPFHEESLASFSVRDNFWICFAGCGKGDSISFKMRIDKLNFFQAIKALNEIK